MSRTITIGLDSPRAPTSDSRRTRSSFSSRVILGERIRLMEGRPCCDAVTQSLTVSLAYSRTVLKVPAECWMRDCSLSLLRTAVRSLQ